MSQFATLNEDGHEVGDPDPIALPAGFKIPETLAMQVQRLVRSHISRQAAEAGFETFEEAEDFEVGDDNDPSTPYETFFDPVLGAEITPTEFKANEAVYRHRYLRAQQDYFRSLDRTQAMQRGAGVSPASTKPKARSEAPKGSGPPPPDEQ